MVDMDAMLGMCVYAAPYNDSDPELCAIIDAVEVRNALAAKTSTFWTDDRHLATRSPQLDFVYYRTCPTQSSVQQTSVHRSLRGAVGHHVSCARRADGCDGSTVQQLAQVLNMRQHAIVSWNIDE